MQEKFFNLSKGLRLVIVALTWLLTVVGFVGCLFIKQYAELPWLEIFQSKIPAVTTGWHSWAFAMNSSLCKYSWACKPFSFSMGHIELLYREFVGTRTLTPNMSLKWSSL